MKQYQKTACLMMLLLSFLLLAACGGEAETTGSNAPDAPNAFTVTFLSDGGTEIAPISVAPGKTVSCPSDPVKKDHDFLGWYVGDEPYDFSKAVSADLTLKAKWAPTVNPASLSGKWIGIEQADGKSYSYALLFSESGAATLSVTCNGVTVSPEITNLRSVRGKLLISYRTQEESSGAFELSVSDTLVGTGLYGGTLTLQRTEAFTVSYHPYRGDVIHQSIDKGGVLAHPELSLDAGLVFDGWYTANGTKMENGTPVTAHVELYASVYTEGLQITDGTVTGYAGERSRVVMPSFYQGNAVTAIANGAFRGLSITSIAFSERLQTIGDYAFYGCTELSALDLKNVTHIGTEAFFDCTELLSIEIPDSMVSIGKGAFASTMTYREFDGFNALMATESSLKRISIPFVGGGSDETAFLAYLFGAERYDDVCYDSEGREVEVGGETKTVHLFYHFPIDLSEVTLRGGNTVPSFAFYNAFYLTKIELQSKISEIGESAFEGCSTVTEISGVESVERLGERAFFACSYAGGKMPVLKEIGDMAFAYSEVRNITLPETLKTIGDMAFAYTALTHITFPEGLESIGSNAFFGCNALKNVTFTAKEPCSVGSLLFTDVDETGTVYYGDVLIWVPDGDAYLAYRESVNLRDYASGIFPVSEKENTGYITQNGVLLGYIGDEPLEMVNVPTGVHTIADFAFCNSPSIVTVNMPEGFEKIGRYAFYNCTSVQHLSMPSTMREIDDYAFTGFFVGNNLSRLYFPEGFVRIGEGAFMSSFNLRIVELPSTLQYVGYLAFGMSNSLERMYFAGTTPPEVGTFTDNNGEILQEIFSIVNAGKTVIYVPFGRENGTSVVDSYRTSPGFSDFSEYIKAKPDGEEVGNYGNGTWFLDLDGCDRVVLSYLREAENDTSDNGGYRYEMIEEIGTYTITGAVLRMEFPTRGTVMAMYNNRTVMLSLDGTNHTLVEPKTYYDSYNWTNFRLYDTSDGAGAGLFDMYGSFLTPFTWRIEGGEFLLSIDGNNKLPEHADYAGVVEYRGTYDKNADTFNVSFMLNDYDTIMNFHCERNDVIYATGEVTRFYGTYCAYAENNPDYAMFTLVSYGNGIVDVFIGESLYAGCTYTMENGVITVDFQTLTLTFTMTSDGHLTGDFFGTYCYFVYEDELMDSTKMPGGEEEPEA